MMLSPSHAMLPIWLDLLIPLVLSLYKVANTVLDQFWYTINCSFAVGTSVVLSNTIYTTNETSPITFQCSATGIPISSISWYKNGSTLTPSSNPHVTVGLSSQQLLSSGLYQVTQTLGITNTTDTDSGNYSCMANNTADSQSATFLLVVQCKPCSIQMVHAKIGMLVPNAMRCDAGTPTGWKGRATSYI